MYLSTYAMIIVLSMVDKIFGHGVLVHPVGRSTIRKYYPNVDVPVNYDDNQLNCGFANDRNCGVCGDDYNSPVPRDNENGGLYGTGCVVREYKQNQLIRVNVSLSAHHKGYFQFAVCPLENSNDVETEDCFASYPLESPNGSDRYIIDKDNRRSYSIDLILPKDLICERCTFRWHWETNNGSGEIYRNCADIAIRARDDSLQDDSKSSCEAVGMQDEVSQN